MSDLGQRGLPLASGFALPSLRAALAAIRRFPLSGTIGALLLALIAFAAIAAPLLGTVDPLALNPARRLRPPSAEYWLGTDMFGRDVYSRLIYGCRTSLAIGLSVAALAIAIGTLLGLFAGYFRALDLIVMRIMDGLMSVPGILLAIATVALTGANITTVIIAVAIPDIPRVVRLLRGVVLSAREEPYVDAAISSGTPVAVILWRHVLPNAISPLLVLGTYLASSAILSEAALSFLGTGLPPEIPSWGNIIAEGRAYFRLRPELVFFPGALLGLTVLAVNMLGDSLRDVLDPRMARQR